MPACCLPILTAESGFPRYLEEIRRFRCWNRRKNTCSPSAAEHGDPEAAHKLVTASPPGRQDRMAIAATPADLRGCLSERAMSA